MPEFREPAIVLAGSVNSSFRTLQALLRHRLKVVGVLGLSAAKSANVSGYTRLDSIARAEGIPFVEFEDVNAPVIVDTVRCWAPDVFFIVGLSQMVKKDLLNIPRMGCVGFHPTALPEGRGRAPVAWMAMEGRSGAATFFMMNERADAGPILAQEPFPVTDADYSADVVEKLEAAIDVALDRWLPRLKEGEWKAVPQAEDRATFYGKRAPEDGIIHWEWPAEKILSLIRAASRPYPGAYTFFGNRKWIIWRAEREMEIPFRGVAGRILDFDKSRGWLVQTGDGLLRLTQTEFEPAPIGEQPLPPKIGALLGYEAENEIYLLKKRLAAMETRLSEMKNPSKGNRKKHEDSCPGDSSR
jgi:methionyl-tRNA formyltransferase